MGLKELLHCRLGVSEEVGEIIGWYKKHLCYGLPKEKITTGLKGELGDLLYYLVKLTDITGHFEILYDHGCTITSDNIERLLSNAVANSATISTEDYNSAGFMDAVVELYTLVEYLADLENWTMEDIMLSNLAKLSKRHGESFKQSQADPSKRDIKGEDEVL